MIAKKETDEPVKTLRQEFAKQQHERNERWKELMQEGVEKRVPRYVEMLANNNPTLRGSLEAMEKTLFEIYERQNPLELDEDAFDRAQNRRIESLLGNFHDLLEGIIDRAMDTGAKLKTKGTIEDPHRSPTDTSMVPYIPRPDNKQ